MTKYQQRRRLVAPGRSALASPRLGDDAARGALFRWIATGAAEGERTRDAGDRREGEDAYLRIRVG